MLKSEELINKVKEYNKFLNPEALTKAYNFALNAHKKQKRCGISPASLRGEHPEAGVGYPRRFSCLEAEQALMILSLRLQFEPRRRYNF